MASVDVIVPCYNYGRFLRECLGSVLSQTGVEVRVLIIDDCSSDGSEDVGRALAAEDPRVEFRRHENNRGHIATYNEGFEWIAADYTLLLSADDLLTSGALQRAADFLDRHPEVGFVYGKVIRWISGQPIPTASGGRGVVPERIISGWDWIEQICTGDPPTTSPELVVRTGLQRLLGGFRPDLPHWGDVEMLMRFAAHACVGQLDCDQAYYRIHPTNMHLAYRGLNDLKQRRIAFCALFRQYGHLVDKQEYLKLRAFRHIAEMAVWAAGRSFEQSDLPTCSSLCDFAKDTFPPITSWSAFRRLRWKMLVGRKAFGIIRSCWRTMKAKRQPPAAQRGT